jgi:hypothetical protein
MNRILLHVSLLMFLSTAVVADDVLEIGSRRELFTDDFLIGNLTGGASQRLHRPEPHDVVLVTGEPWEGNTCAYYSIFQDGDIYRMYYRGSHYNVATKRATHPEVTCYAESKDGINWTKPNLGLFEFNGSKKNNIVWDGLGTHCFTPFKDQNPKCPKDAQYKAISRGKLNGTGLFVFKSPDGIHWKLIVEKPVITKGAFDSQNLAFWDPHTKQYVDYHRIFVNGVRAIMTCTSDDFVNWTEPVLLKYPDSPKQHLYTNAVRPYARAQHIRVGFPTRFTPKGSRVEPLFMSSRDGVTFKRYNDPVIPQSAPKDRDGNRSNYMTNGLLSLPGKPNELSVYATEAYYTGPDSRVRRFSYRVDGFVSISSTAKVGELITKAFRYTGSSLSVNASTNKGGSIRWELQTATGTPIKGLSLADTDPISGDSIDHVSSLAAIKQFAGKPVRLRIVLDKADLYSIRFK